MPLSDASIEELFAQLKLLSPQDAEAKAVVLYEEAPLDWKADKHGWFAHLFASTGNAHMLAACWANALGSSSKLRHARSFLTSMMLGVVHKIHGSQTCGPFLQETFQGLSSHLSEEDLGTLLLQCMEFGLQGGSHVMAQAALEFLPVSLNPYTSIIRVLDKCDVSTDATTIERWAQSNPLVVEVLDGWLYAAGYSVDPFPLVKSLREREVLANSLDHSGLRPALGRKL